MDKGEENFMGEKGNKFRIIFLNSDNKCIVIYKKVLNSVRISSNICIIISVKKKESIFFYLWKV